jgi:hypothetical protein
LVLERLAQRRRPLTDAGRQGNEGGHAASLPCRAPPYQKRTRTPRVRGATWTQ